MYNNQYYSEFHSSLEQRVLQYQLEKEKEETRIHSLFCKLVPYMHHIGIILKYKDTITKQYNKWTEEDEKNFYP